MADGTERKTGVIQRRGRKAASIAPVSREKEQASLETSTQELNAAGQRVGSELNAVVQEFRQVMDENTSAAAALMLDEFHQAPHVAIAKFTGALGGTPSREGFFRASIRSTLAVDLADSGEAEAADG